MARNSYDYFEDPDELEGLPAIRNLPLRRAPRAGRPRRRPKAAAPPQEAPGEPEAGFDFSYGASRHEREWIVNSLGGFHDQHWLDDVLRLVQGGKEAHVYQCLASPSVPGLAQPYLAAKIYRPRRFRGLKNDALYRQGRQPLDSEGRVILDGGMLHALAKRSEWGLALQHSSWIEHEVQTLRLLEAAGADVPRFLASGDNAILMSYIGDQHIPAPTLNSLELDPGEARLLFQRALHNVELMLANGRVHGDLSAYNILYWQGEITLIDFPQAVDPLVNPNAFAIFERDIVRTAEYFARQGMRSEPRSLARKMWVGHGYRRSPEVSLALLDPEDGGDRAYWREAEEQMRR